MLKSALLSLLKLHRLFMNRSGWKQRLALIPRIPGMPKNIPSLELPGFQLSYPDERTFRQMFDQIFIWREYAFKSERECPFIIDCGSNIGLSILFFNREYPRSRIIGFEPDVEIFSYLCSNIQRNNLGNIEIHNSAVYDRAGTIDFYSDLDRKTFVGMSATRRLAEKDMRLKTTTVNSVLLSEYVTGPVDLLKMDIEGVELKIIRELQEKDKLGLIRQCFIEYHYNPSNPDNNFCELLRIIESSGLKYIIHGAHRPPYYQYRDRAYNSMIYAYR